jgi:hypothetical protein
MCVRGNRKGKEDLWLDMMWFVMFSRFSMDYPDCPLSLDGTELSSTVFLSPWRTPRTVLAVFEGLHISMSLPILSPVKPSHTQTQARSPQRHAAQQRRMGCQWS